MASTTNPFIYDPTITPTEFLGRETELRRLFSRLGNRQSAAIIGQSHIGKNSLLRYVEDAKVRQASFGARFDRDLFKFLDAQFRHAQGAHADRALVIVLSHAGIRRRPHDWRLNFLRPNARLPRVRVSRCLSLPAVVMNQFGPIS